MFPLAKNKKWRIVTSSGHSTALDGQLTVFDMNYLTLGISVEECVERAFLSRRYNFRCWRIP